MKKAQVLSKTLDLQSLCHARMLPECRQGFAHPAVVIKFRWEWPRAVESLAIIVSAGSVHRLLRSKGFVHLCSVKTHGFESFSPWLIRGSIEVCISQEKPVILQDACPGRLLMDTYGNRK